MARAMSNERSRDPSVRVCRVDHTRPSVARSIHAVQIDAYTQEATLLGVSEFPPLNQSVEDIRTSQEEFFVAYRGERLVGSISVQPEDGGTGRNVSSLVVAPLYQRQGIAGKLLTAVLRRYAGDTLTVQTGADNRPALTLYAQHGFVEYRRWCVGPQRLELVELRRIPSGPEGVANAAGRGGDSGVR